MLLSARNVVAKPRILLVDDLRDSLTLLERTLSRHLGEAEILQCQSGGECIDIAQRRDLDLILLDAKMPVMDGFETCRRLKSDPKTSIVPVLMVSGVMVDTRDRVAGLECGADGYVCKPFEPLELIAQVKALLRVKSVEDQLRAREKDLEHELAVRTRSLVDSEQRFRILFEQSPDAVFVEDETGAILDVNPAACDLHGLSREDLLQSNILDLVPEEERAQVKQRFPAWFTGELKRIESWSFTKDGRRVPVEILANRTQYAGRKAVILHVRDVSYRKAAEHALEMSEARYRAIVEDQPEMVMRWTFDGNLTFVNESTCRFVGQSREKLLGGSFFSWLPEDAVKELKAEIARLSPEEPVVIYRNRFKTPAGYRWTQWSNRAIYDPLRNLTEIQSVGRDITDQVLAEEKLKATSAGLRAVVDIADELLASPDLETLYQRAVELAREKLGLERAGIMVEEGGFVKGTFGTDLEGRTTDERHHRTPLTATWIERFRLRSPNEPRYVVVREEYRVWKGQITTLSGEGWICITPIQTARQSLGVFCNDCAISKGEVDEAKQEIVAVYCSLLANVIERKKAEAELRQSQKMESIGRLAGGIAHDFNNLLTAILGFARLAYDGVEKNSPLRSDLQEVINAGERAAKLTKQLLAFGRKQVVQMRPLDVNSIVVNMDSILRRTLGEDIELVAMLGENLGTINADTGLIEQVIMNLAVNARDAMQRGGKLVISTTHVPPDDPVVATHLPTTSHGCVMLSIRDTGIGMPAEVREHVFEPFFTTKDKGKGSGLGLSTVYGIVVQCGGHIEFDSETNLGTEFRIYFPRSTAQAVEPVAQPTATVRGGNERILLVEDESTVRRLALRCLQAMGYLVVEARNGEEALRIFQQDPKGFGLVLTDVVMPQMGGPEMVSHLRNQRPDLRVLFMSGFTEDILPEQSGAALLTKPFTRESLAQAVRAILDAP